MLFIVYKDNYLVTLTKQILSLKIQLELENVITLGSRLHNGCGCGVAHTVAHTTPVREDLGSILHTPMAFIQKLSSPFFHTTDLKTI